MCPTMLVSGPARLVHSGTSMPRLAILLVAVILTSIATGCAPNQLTSARDAMAEHHYGDAHTDLVAIMNQPSRLTPDEWREVADDLCLTETKIGPPAYQLAEQRLQCARAAAIPGSRSGPALNEIDAQIAAAYQDQFTSAVADRDLADALTIALDYDSIAGGNGQLSRRWREQIWSLVDMQDAGLAAARHGRDARLAIARCRGEYPHIRSLDTANFQRWIASQTAVDGGSLFTEINVSGSTAKLSLAPRSLPVARRNLLKLSEVNDAVIARCRCAGQTNVVMTDSGLPAYLVRISPANGNSQILIMPQ